MKKLVLITIGILLSTVVLSQITKPKSFDKESKGAKITSIHTVEEALDVSVWIDPDTSENVLATVIIDNDTTVMFGHRVANFNNNNKPVLVIVQESKVSNKRNELIIYYANKDKDYIESAILKKDSSSYYITDLR